MEKFKTSLMTGGAVLASMALAPMAMAQETSVDVSAATDALGAVGVAVAAIGVAMVAAISAGIVYRWVVAFLAK